MTASVRKRTCSVKASTAQPMESNPPPPRIPLPSFETPVFTQEAAGYTTNRILFTADWVGRVCPQRAASLEVSCDGALGTDAPYPSMV